MPRLSARSLAIAAAVVVLVPWWVCGDAQDAKPAKQPAQAGEPVKGLKPFYYSNSQCGDNRCHGSPKAAEDNVQVLKGGGYTLLSAHNELTEWDAKDKHQIATSVLTQKRGQEIAKALGIAGDIADPKTNKQWRQCLSCHGVVIDDEQLASKEFGPEARVASGVSCVVCHGAYKKWVEKHPSLFDTEWEDLTRAQKKAWGLRDMWDPVERARMCCSCHVGNAASDDAENRVVTHEMYAAGHPPLPSFEMVTFTKYMPQHWQTVQQKEKRLSMWGKQSTKEVYAKLYNLGGAAQQQLELLLASAITSVRQSAQMIAAYADPKMPQGKGGAWPEFALYDCYACHHDLKQKSWRQERGYDGKPGRPQMQEWPRALLPLAQAVKQSQEAADLPKALHSLQDALSKAPFGEPADVLRAANAIVKSSDAVLSQLQQAQLNREEAARLFDVILTRNERTLIDFDSARQVTCALEVLAAQAQRKVPQQPLERLNMQLNLPLPGGKRPLLEEYVPATMTKRADYDATVFQQHLKVLAEELSRK